MRQQIRREGHGGVETAAVGARSAFIRTTLAARVHGDDALVERFDDGAEQRVVRLERRRVALASCSVIRCSAMREIADFAGCGEGGAPLEIAGRDRPRDVAQLDDRAATRCARTRSRARSAPTSATSPATSTSR